MNASRFALAGALCGLVCAATAATGNGMPSINPDGVVNAATGQPGLAPNAICSIYGENLFFDNQTGTGSGAALPYNLGGLTVLVGGFHAGIFYASPNQINVLIPNILIPSSTEITIVRNGLGSNTVPVVLQEVAPGLFAAVHADGTAITSSAPAVAGEVILLYGTGFGRTQPEPEDGSGTTSPAPLIHTSDFQVLLDGVTLDGSLVQYAGAAPSNAGLYQVNVQLPSDLSPNNPQVQVSVAGVLSPAGFSLITGND
jgi:uncharacterized protein (TIGR03437 family)